MASAKTARSRGTPVKENGTKLEEGLSFFKSDKFDAQSFVQSRCALNEKVVVRFQHIAKSNLQRVTERSVYIISVILMGLIVGIPADLERR